MSVEDTDIIPLDTLSNNVDTAIPDDTPRLSVEQVPELQGLK
jgi:hypothetical protein